MSTGRALSRRSLIATGLAAGTVAAFAPAFAQQQMTAEKMRDLIDYTIRRNREDKKDPTIFSKTVTPILFGRTDEISLFQIGNDEGALKERFSVTLNLAEQQVVLFSRTEDAIYFHLTGVHLRRVRSAVNRREGGASILDGSGGGNGLRQADDLLGGTIHDLIPNRSRGPHTPHPFRP